MFEREDTWHYGIFIDNKIGYAYGSAKSYMLVLLGSMFSQ